MLYKRLIPNYPTTRMHIHPTLTLFRALLNKLYPNYPSFVPRRAVKIENYEKSSYTQQEAAWHNQGSNLAIMSKVLCR